MSTTTTVSRHGQLTDARTFTIQRRLPGPAERVWQHLVDGELRRRWLAAGALTPRAGSSFELVWRNDELSASPAERPDGFAAESRATCQVLEAEAGRRLRFAWPGVGDVCFELEPDGDGVLLTVTHRGLPDAATIGLVAAGWHAHLDLLAARLEGTEAPSFWSHWLALRDEYRRRLAA